MFRRRSPNWRLEGSDSSPLPFCLTSFPFAGGRRSLGGRFSPNWGISAALARTLGFASSATFTNFAKFSLKDLMSSSSSSSSSSTYSSSTSSSSTSFSQHKPAPAGLWKSGSRSSSEASAAPLIARTRCKVHWSWSNLTDDKGSLTGSVV